MTEQFEQAKREFAEKHKRTWHQPDGNVFEKVNNLNELLSDLNALLEQHKEVMFEFTEWWGRICIEQHGQYNSMEIPQEICGLITMQELFDYWLKNVKK